MPLLCVPLLNEFYGETALDLKAIYRRRKEDNWGQPILDKDGLEEWDTTAPLPMRRHMDYVRKRFEYITLADEDSLEKAAPLLQQHGYDVRAFIQDKRTRSPWNPTLYLDGMEQAKDTEYAKLEALVAQYGAETVTEIMQQTKPGFVLPLSLREPQGLNGEIPRRGRPRKTQEQLA